MAMLNIFALLPCARETPPTLGALWLVGQFVAMVLFLVVGFVHQDAHCARPMAEWMQIVGLLSLCLLCAGFIVPFRATVRVAVFDWRAAAVVAFTLALTSSVAGAIWFFGGSEPHDDDCRLLWRVGVGYFGAVLCAAVVSAAALGCAAGVTRALVAAHVDEDDDGIAEEPYC